MSNAIEPGYIVPTPQSARTLGLLSIVFASILIIMSLFSALSMFMMPAMRRIAEAQQARLERDVTAKHEAAKRADLESLAERSKVADTPQEKAEIEAEKASIRGRQKPFVPDTTLGFRMVQDRWFAIYTWFDVATGIPLNIAMLIAGIGLLRLRHWGRTAALWVAAIKLARCVALLAMSVLVISPIMTKFMGQYLQKTATQIAQKQGNNPANAARMQQMMSYMTKIMSAAMTGGYIFYFVLAMIFPAVTIYVLSRPGVRAAFFAAERDRAAKPEEPEPIGDLA